MDLAALNVLLAPWLATGMGVMMRVAGMMFGMPLFIDGVMPPRVRSSLVVMMSLLLVLGVGPSVAAPANLVGWLLLLVPELLVGLGLGVMLRVLFAVGSMMGQATSMMMGLGFATVLDPASGGMSDNVGRIVRLLAVLVFIAVDGHVLALRAVGDTLIAAPVGTFSLTDVSAASQSIAAQGSLLFTLATRLAAPVIAGVLMVYTVLGVIARVAPQMNLFAFGFVLTIPVGLYMLMMSMPQLVLLFTSAFEQLPDRMLLWTTTGVAL